ncbi:cytochrome-c peroxidase [Haliscomenobacter hydrossis]|uniref:Cytochrome-c peroxidase n=1 Tax=Haliscomenobacter hydrossis (strain ATCC 27775 / DSM 1100 / LMG 10767 / O) TaxID=760192 RepID=F4L7B6_HALH1|nr:cytochrome c peroxidase [Haliscomenobacter hydrossis]AEE53143.1 Cytochrome-c peroxidase [Haliscomenobacter hydrossis DSM 1100]
MRNKSKQVVYGLLVVVCCSIYAFEEIKTTPKPLVVPAGWPQPGYDFSKNPLTEEGFELGRQLFYDPILSRDQTISCASCHLQATGFTHVDHDLSHGIEDKIGTRNSMTIMNLAWSKHFMWDGGVNHLDMQPLAPLSSAVEMDENLENVVHKLNASTKYRTLFYRAFNDSLATGQKVLLAFSQFIVHLNSYQSKYDKYIRKEEGGVFTEQERNGLQLFRVHCAACHPEPLFTNQGFEKNGLPIDPTLNDFGRMRITQNPQDSLKFKVPTLRNIQFTFPYMHDGRFKKLREVLNHYTSSTQLEKPIVLSADEKVDLLAFLLTLTDQAFLYDRRFGFPKE